jgi:hypothetical protein
MDRPEEILENTRNALVDLREQLLKLRDTDKDPTTNAGEAKRHGKRKAMEDDREPPGKLWSCKINSGLFAVNWADTRTVLEEELQELGTTVHVVSRVSGGG